MTNRDQHQVYFGDLHNHCAISYGHGSLHDAIRNAREQLDFVSITGHAHWPDMPARDGEIDDIIDFHEIGFARLKEGWSQMMEELKFANEEGHFVLFPAFEVHFSADGDRNVIYRDLDGEILYPNSLTDLHEQLCRMREKGVESIAQPHHVGYRTGTRGINWKTHDSEHAPFVELLSMHGCSEDSDSTRPFLHSMGPSDHESTVRHGLDSGHVFGFSGGTDHHSAHPGSYGHGRVAVWAPENTRHALWEAFQARRMYALTGDRIRLDAHLNGASMGAQLPSSEERHLEVEVQGGGAIDAVDVIRNGEVVKRFSCPHHATREIEGIVRTIIFLEVGWGRRNRPFAWNLELEIEDGEILEVEPRFRGREVVSPLEGEQEESFYESRVLGHTTRSVSWKTVTRGNPNNSTPTGQGMALHVEMPVNAKVRAHLNGIVAEWPLRDLMKGARSGHVGKIDSPAWRFHRSPSPDELHWKLAWEDHSSQPANYYVRVRQTNDQWAWSSPFFIQ